ncbi:MAG: methyltransferase domain-containing protein [Steroidobacteraceae bacterium]
MAFTLNDVVPWGRNLAEYCAMFDLSQSDRQLSILGCGDGPASFNAEGTAQGMRIVSVDPLYALRASEIRERIDTAARDVAEQLRSHSKDFVWTHFADVDAVIATRLAAMEQFIADYDPGIAQGRYVTGDVLDLPFHDNCYDLALCSHLLFLYSERHNLAFQLKALRELTRVAEEVRVFPLLEMSAMESRHLSAVMMALPRLGLRVEKVRVPYEFQRGGNEMLRITR